MAQEPRKLGILLSVAPDHPNFLHGLQLATAALNARDEVYLYCLDEAVRMAGGVGVWGQLHVQSARLRRIFRTGRCSSSLLA